MSLFDRHTNLTQAIINNFLTRLDKISLTHEEANYLIQKIEERRNAPVREFENKA